MSPDVYPHAKQRGVGLPLALFVITVLSLLVAFMAQIQQSTQEQLSLQLQSMRAFLAAESGAQAAVSLVMPPDGGAGRACAVSPFHQVTFATPGLRGCTATVRCRADTGDGATYHTLQSEGRCGGGADEAVRVVEVRVR
ncbi:MAG: hypothetical protein LPK85_09870, partial [Gammaproteobacteria bacterium]|nr:hypothetical protein [Gammaproteobacteria bacterium]